MKILEFLQKVSTDEKHLENFTNNPEKSMDEAGLSEEEKSAIRTADREKIASLVEPEASREAAGLNVKVRVKLEVQIDV